MTLAGSRFETNLAQARDLVGMAVAVDAATTAAFDTSDLLRFALVSSVSSLDHYIHEVVRELMIDSVMGLRKRSEGFSRFTVSAEAALRAAEGESPEFWMDEEVRRQHGHLSFQHPDKMADAIRLVWDLPLWNTLAPEIGRDAKELKQELLLIVTRRNRIAHEADRDPTPPHERWPITSADVQNAIELISSVVTALDALLDEPPE
jgi:hypothetical protein